MEEMLKSTEEMKLRRTHGRGKWQWLMLKRKQTLTWRTILEARVTAACFRSTLSRSARITSASWTISSAARRSYHPRAQSRLRTVKSSGKGLSTPNGVFTRAWSGTGTGTSIMQNLSHCTGTWKNGLYGFNKNLSHCTWTGTGKNTSIHHRAHFQDLKNGYQTHSSGPENVPGVLPCPCSGAVWKVLIKTIQPILPGPCPCPSPGSGPSQSEYTIREGSH